MCKQMSELNGPFAKQEENLVKTSENRRMVNMGEEENLLTGK
jgi:hypothetical protein